MRPLSFLAAALLATSAVAQLSAQPSTQAPMPVPGTPDASRVAAGNYAVEPSHTQIIFAVDHMGFSIFRGFLSQASGTLTIDPAKLSATQLSVTLPVSSIHTTSAKLDEELNSADWLGTQQFPTATFVSTKVTLGPQGAAMIEGNLTLHGVTKPARLLAHFRGAGANPMSKATTIGFDGRMTIDRSQFGVTKYVPLVSDHVEVTIAAAFEKQS
jgi:polyisoprenoid-binding protein YceI